MIFDDWQNGITGRWYFLIGSQEQERFTIQGWQRQIQGWQG